MQYEHCKTTFALIIFNFIRLQLELGIFPFFFMEGFTRGGGSCLITRL